MRLAWAVKRVGGLLGGLIIFLIVVPTPAFAVGPGLPHTYDVQRIASPRPALGGTFGQGMASAGDVNRDGEDDLLLPQQANSPNDDGQVFVISGATGALIDTIVSPDPGGTGDRAQLGSFWTSRIGANRTSAPFSDIGSCPGGSSGQLCTLPTIGPADGVPDIVAGARGVDARGLRDAGRVYIFDGATRALLKRIDQPAEDTTPLALSRPGGTWFGRTALNPVGLPACEGNYGVGSCSTGVPRAVEIGDMDGGGQPDLVIGASLTTENSTTAYPTSHCARTPGAACAASGRVYVYRGEEIVGSSPGEVLDGAGPGETFKRVRNLAAQADDPLSSVSSDPELFGNTLTPIGDVGSCNLAGIAPGDRCPRANSVTTPDGRPEVLIGGVRIDSPIDNPDPALPDVGAGFLVDGATGAILFVYPHPEPQRGTLFSYQPSHHGPAVGELGDTLLPDVYMPAVAQDVKFKADGRGYVMNGNFRTNPTSVNFARLDDPTPHQAENFGPMGVGVGDLVGGAENPANELLIGALGGFFNPAPKQGIISDVHFFNAFTQTVLQTIPDPDQQGGSSFGGAIVPLGDINGDTFLDFAVGAERFSGTTGINEGRIYIFRSDNSRAPTPPGPGTGAPRQQPTQVLPPFADCPALSANLIRGSAGGGRLTGTVRGDRIFGGTGNDIVDGLAGDDCIDLGPGVDSGQGGLGNDLMLGGLGNDRMAGDSGSDRIRGGSSTDRIEGGFGDDVLHGQSGNDRVNGSRGGDRINGGSSNDVISAGSSGDRVAGDEGNDRINGNSGNDLLKGNSGKDRITGSTGRDRISSGSGADRINSRDGQRDRVNCGSGRRDTVVADRRDRVSGNCERVLRR